MEEVGGGQVGPFEDLEVIRREAGMSTARFVKLTNPWSSIDGTPMP